MANVADAATSHVATSTHPAPGSCWPAACPKAVTTMSAAVPHHTTLRTQPRRPANTSSHGTSAASTPAAIGRPQRRAPGTCSQAVMLSAAAT